MTEHSESHSQSHTAVFLTTCTAEKSSASGAIPAHTRYRGARIAQAKARAAQAGMPLFFLSGVYGVIHADHPLEWYDHALQPHEVDGMVAPVVTQLRQLGIDHIHALLCPITTPGWAPYHRLLTAACQRAGVTVTVVETTHT